MRLMGIEKIRGITSNVKRLGYRYHLANLHAAIGIEQMKKLPERVIRKKEIWSLYLELLENIKGIKLFHHDLHNTSPWFIDSIVENRDELMEYLKKEGIGTRVMYPPINKQKAYSIPGDHKVSERIGEEGLWLPSYVQLRDEDIERICLSIRKFYY